MLFAITDTVRKHFPGYESGAYNHPMVRCELFFESARRAMAGSSEEARELWRDVSTQGWMKCIEALEQLNLEALQGKYGELPPERHMAPLHAMIYSIVPMGPTDRALLDLMQETQPVLAEVRKLLPLFGR
jgi:hypothetical protein